MGLLLLLFSNCRKEESPFGKYKNQQKVNSHYDETLIVYFKDKKTNEYQLDKPKQYLSQRALARRKNQQINIDSTDLPVSSNYLSQLVNSTKGKILQTSKWLNYAVIQLPEGFQEYKAIEQLNFVIKTKKLGVHIAFEEPIFSISDNTNAIKPFGNSQQLESLLVNERQYGNTLRLLNQYQARVLHQNNYFGKDKATYWSKILTTEHSLLVNQTATLFLFTSVYLNKRKLLFKRIGISYLQALPIHKSHPTVKMTFG